MSQVAPAKDAAEGAANPFINAMWPWNFMQTEASPAKDTAAKPAKSSGKTAK